MSQNAGSDNHASEPEEVRVGILPIAGEHSTIVNTVKATISEAGWRSERIDPASVVAGSRPAWQLIVIIARSISSDVLISITHAAYDLAARVLIVSENRDPRSVADALRSGADDYLPYPFASEELKVRMRSLVLRNRHARDRRRDGQIIFDFPSRTITSGPSRVSLSEQEWRILIALLETEGHPADADELSALIPNANISSAALAAMVSRLRRKLRSQNFSAIYIDTVRGKGYVGRFRRSTDTYQSSRINRP